MIAELAPNHAGGTDCRVDVDVVVVSVCLDRCYERGIGEAAPSHNAVLGSGRWRERLHNRSRDALRCDMDMGRDDGAGQVIGNDLELDRPIEDVEDLPVMGRNTGSLGRPLVSDVATVDYGTTPGEVDRYNMQRVVSFTANLEGKPLGQTLDDVRQAIARAGAPPRGVNVFNRGQVPAFEETLAGLRSGVLLAIVVIFLLLAANFQSFRLALAVVSAVPAVICGVLLMLLITATTLNVQSFMGAIMAVGISVANAILFVTFAEHASSRSTISTSKSTRSPGSPDSRSS